MCNFFRCQIKEKIKSKENGVNLVSLFVAAAVVIVAVEYYQI